MLHLARRGRSGRSAALRRLVALALLSGAQLSPVTARAQAPSPDSLRTPAPGSAAGTISPPRVGGYIQARQTAVEGVGFSSFLNRARASVDGALPARFAYRLLVEFQAAAGVRAPATVSLREAVARWNPAPFAVTLGEFKTPFTREYLIPVPALEVADLAVAVDSIAPRYDVGVMGEYAYGPYATLAVGAFNGEGANAIANRDSVAIVVARATVRPLPQLSLGGSYSRDGADSLRWGVDAAFQCLGLGGRAEYLTRHVDGRERSNDDFGWYVLEGFRVVPRFTLYARQEDFQRPAIGASRRVRAWEYAANVDIAPSKVRLLVQFTRRIAGARSQRLDTFLAQVQVQL
jgi:hypothetical protein